ncbi:MAG: hypothetical protein GX786_02810 [Clostridiales bacterium]|nr:hypothetical protein [Clostridiales bacterium]
MRDNMERFLRYSLEKKKKIKVIFCKENIMRAENIQVCAIEGTTLSYISARQKKPKKILLEEILCAGYARGDHGEGGDNCNGGENQKTF